MFGTLFYHEEDLADAIFRCDCRYTSNGRKGHTKKKMYAISAEHFGKSVYAFYLDVLISAKNKKKSKLSIDGCEAR